MAAPGEAMTIIAGIAHKLKLPSAMLEAVNMMALEHFELNVDQRKLLITAYKDNFSPKHRALRVISSMEQDEGYRNCTEYIVFYRELLEHDMQAMCRNALNIVENHLLPFCRVAENATLYNKMIGDTCWILAMLNKEEDKVPLVQKALTAFETASKEAKSLSPADPLRLSVHLTVTAFYHDVMKGLKWRERAYALAKQTLDEARPELVLLDKESHKESTLYMGLIEKNLKMWSTPKDPEVTLSFKEPYLQTASSYSTGFPCPEVPQSSVTAEAPDSFISRGDWGYDVHEGLSLNEIRFRKKAALMKKGRMG